MNIAGLSCLFRLIKGIENGKNKICLMRKMRWIRGTARLSARIQRGIPMCADCKWYGETPVVREFPVEFLRSEKCDCVEKHGRIQHHNGGNYHIITYIVDNNVTDTDMTDTEYDEVLAEQFEGIDNTENVPFRQWQKQEKK